MKMKKHGAILMVLCAAIFGAVGAQALGGEHIRSVESKKVEDKDMLYKSKLFGLNFRKPAKFEVEKESNFGFRVGDDCDTALREDCEACGNISDDTKVEFLVEYKSKDDELYTYGGFGAIVTSENASGKTADEILKQKIDADISYYNLSSECSECVGYFNQTIAGEKFSSGWIIEMGKANWIRKIFVMIKNNRAMIIYLDCSGDGKYDFKKSKYMVKKIESPSKNDDAMFYKCFLKNSKDSDELGIYSVQNGDNLWKISEHFYGDGTLFDKVKNHNKLKSGGLRIGQSLRIPKI